jgi:hypothetical protein
MIDHFVIFIIITSTVIDKRHLFMKRPTQSARTFSMESYSKDAFESFTKDGKNKPLNQMESRSQTDLILQNQDKNHHSLDINNQGPKTITLVPIHLEKIQRIVATPISNRRTCGKTNLAELNRTNNLINNPSRAQALGLTEAGCPSSEQRSLEANSAYGSLKLRPKKIKFVSPKFPFIGQKSNQIVNGKTVEWFQPTCMYDVLNIQRCSFDNW